MFSKWLHGICYCLLVVASATVASGQGLSVNSIPNAGLVQPLTPTSSGAAGAMPAACPAGQALTLINSSTYTCQPFEGGTGSIPPGTNSQLLGYDNNNNPENQTVSGGSGNCLYTRTNLNAGSITCANYMTMNGGTFTGAVSSPIFYMNNGSPGYGLLGVPGSGVAAGGATLRPNSVAIPTGGQYLIGDAPLNFSFLAGTATDAQLANAYSGIGACPAGDVVTGLSRNGAPTCNTISGSGGAPLVNPPGGQNNYAAIANPQHTGDMTITSPTSGILLNSNVGIVGSITTAGSASGFMGVLGGAHYAGGGNWISDSNGPTGIIQNGQIGMYGGTSSTGATWNPMLIGTFANAGLTMAAGTSITTPGLTVNGAANVTGGLQANTIGVGLAPSSGAGTILVGSSNGNYATAISIGNNSTGVSASTVVYVNNATHYGAIQLYGTGNTGFFGADSFVVGTSGAGGLILNSASPAPINFFVNNVGIGAIWANGLLLSNTASSSVYWGNTGQPTGSILSNGSSDNLNLTAGAHYNGSWIADAPQAQDIGLSSGGITFYLANNLTVGGGVGWIQEGIFNANGFGFLHTGAPAGSPGGPPGCNNCNSISAYSNDTFGLVFAWQWPVTLSFHGSFAGGAECIITPQGGAGWIPYTGSSTNTSIQIGCLAANGAACGGNLWFSYFCFGLGL